MVEGSDAGGHLGFSKDDLLAHETQSLEDIVKDVAALDPEIPVFAAGSVFDAEDIRRMRAAGAEGVQIATRFIVTEECDASPEFKKAILEMAR